LDRNGSRPRALPGSFPVWWLGGVPVVICPPEIDLANVAELAIALQAAAVTRTTIVVDLAGTEFCDCSMLGVLVRARRWALASGGDLRLVVRNEQVRRIFVLTRLDREFAIFGRLSAAVRPDLWVIPWPDGAAGQDGWPDGSGPSG
jgi:anti-anti-sigma factor